MKTLCCGCQFKDNDCPVKWNPYNVVVQCHNCGMVWEPKQYGPQVEPINEESGERSEPENPT